MRCEDWCLLKPLKSSCKRHLGEVATIDTKLGLLHAQRAEMQMRCLTEHNRLIQLVMTKKDLTSTEINGQAGDYDVPVFTPQNRSRPTYQEMRRQLAVAPPG